MYGDAGHYNRAVRTLKTGYEALSRFLWPAFGDKLADIDVNDLLYIDVSLIHQQVLEIQECLSKDNVNVLLYSENFKKVFTSFMELTIKPERANVLVL